MCCPQFRLKGAQDRQEPTANEEAWGQKSRKNKRPIKRKRSIDIR